MQNTKNVVVHKQALSVFGRRKYESLVESFKKQSNGALCLQNITDLEFLLRSNRLCPSLAEIASADREISKSGGECSLKVFLDIAARCENGTGKSGTTEFMEFFSQFDPMNQGYIHPSMFRLLMTSCGERFSQAQVDEIIEAFSETSTGGMINYRKIITTITSV